MNFVKLYTTKYLKYSLQEIDLPISNVNDSQIINLVSCFEPKSKINKIDFTQSKHITDIALRNILTQFDLTTLSTLSLIGTSVSDFFIEDLMEIPNSSKILKSISILDLSYCELISSDGFKDLFSLKNFLSLRDLRVSYTLFCDEGFKEVWTNTSMKKLENFEVQGCRKIDEEELELIMDKECQLSSLVSLNLQDINLSEKVVEKLFQLRMKSLKFLDKLNLSCNDKLISLESIKGTIQSRPFKSLDISWTKIQDFETILSIIEKSETKLLFKGLKSVTNNIDSIKKVFQNSSPQLIDICCLEVDEEHVLAGLSGVVHHIETMNIISCFTLAATFFEILLGQKLNQLQYLNLTGTLCSDDALQYLSLNKHCENIKSLNLSKCINLTDLALQYIDDSKFIERLETLDMSFTNISDNALGFWNVYNEEHDNIKWRSLKNLYFKMCKKIKDQGVLNLLKAKWLMAQLLYLDLSHNSLGFKTLKRVLKLGLSFNEDRSMIVNLHCCPMLYKPVPIPITFMDQENLNSGLKKITKQYLLALCESPSSQLLLPELKLNLVSELSDPIFTQMLQSKLFKNNAKVKLIDISFTNIGPMSIRLLSDTESISQSVEQLYLAGCYIGNLSVERLLRNKLPQLVILDLSQTKITDKSLETISRSTEQLPMLNQLVIDWCDLVTQNGVFKFKSDCARNDFRNLKIQSQPQSNS